jgi:hypothetical protein
MMIRYIEAERLALESFELDGSELLELIDGRRSISTSVTGQPDLVVAAG